MTSKHDKASFSLGKGKRFLLIVILNSLLFFENHTIAQDPVFQKPPEANQVDIEKMDVWRAHNQQPKPFGLDTASVQSPDLWESFEGVEAGELPPEIWKLSGNQRARISSHKAREGGNSVKFQVFANETVNYRDELVFHGGPFREMGYGTEWWFGFSVYIPDTWKPDPSGEIFFQVHRVRDKHDPPNVTANPPIALIIREKAAYFTHRWDGQDPWKVHKHSFSQSKKIINTIEAGKWYDFVLHFVWSKVKDKTGLTECWVGDSLRYSQVGPNAYVDQKGPYIKYGIYKPLWKRSNYTDASAKRGIFSRSYYYDDVRVFKGKDGYGIVRPEIPEIIEDTFQENKEKEEVPVDSANTIPWINTSDLKVYPNPAQDIVHIKRPKGLREDAQLILYDLKGMTHHKDFWEKEVGEISLNLGHLPPGLYLLLAKDSFQIFQTKIMLN